ncbi:Mucin-associated surface protein (MASP) [Trypanosoma cruzi]|uniref:Mucin-associated surface protein (MASP), putative n=2 Tax=Trypanosoma cruzi TaxID=5693 RepID=Q4DFV6_TRYCC|nr:mucin-associated surface protein (MASP), putative [Trypanosoma cruzi]EAN91405.1 mucin-associated surface protein (MASP), putative [Trypanosoma cruzi]PWV14206.1 Mucin-associated surface protein (MASP) [Trypanosoma cruzi]RNC38666.1 mucin-associated surface protein (MASP) [Trypanosoma cruzi]|eukprot:XP_813256.1 mucin-associated surface protein (MASP) [Trypanosoma cruzi strain CL Brener]
MAMMMTGRVLLVCALCVLWCGAGGTCDAAVGVGAQLDGGKSPPESKGVETPSQGTQDLKGGAAGVKEDPPPLPTEEDDEDVVDDSEEGDDGRAEGEEEEKVQGQSGQEGKVALGSESTGNKSSGSEKQTELSIESAGSISPSGSRELNVNLTQTEVEGRKETDKNTPAVENPLTTGIGESTLPAGIVEGNPSPPPPLDGIHSREEDGEGTASEGQKNVPSPETAATPQSHHDKSSEGTGENTKATTVTANTTGTTSTQNSDSGTAVSHTTSPLLLLLVVACAAAAVVAA